MQQARSEGALVLVSATDLAAVLVTSSDYYSFLMKAPVRLWPTYRLGYPENYLMSLSKKKMSGSKNPKNIRFHFENRSTEKRSSFIADSGYIIKVNTIFSECFDPVNTVFDDRND